MDDASKNRHSRRQVWTIVVLLFVLNLVVWLVQPSGYVGHIDGRIDQLQGVDWMLRSISVMVASAVPAVLLAGVIAAFPAGGLTYNTRFYRALGWSLVVAYLFWLVAGLYMLLAGSTAPGMT